MCVCVRVCACVRACVRASVRVCVMCLNYRIIILIIISLGQILSTKFSRYMLAHYPINSSASAPLNDQKCAMKKVSDVDVRFGPELKLSMCKCCFWRVFAQDIAHSG